MPRPDEFESALTAGERAAPDGLSTPRAVQDFLDGCAYSSDPFYRCPLRVLRERRAHCFDGALFAAAALRRLGHPPRILDLLSDGRDDEHLLALFKADGRWGAVAQSNFSGLRYREPVYASVRELAMSYFEPYYNLARERTLVGYTGPLSLAPFDRLRWTVSDEHLERIAERTEQVRRIALITPAMHGRLTPVDERSYRAGLLGSDAAGLFKPE
ncbi:MAG: hypothetical protein IPH09_10245 [bacterium]|nr:hypothetical protein [bacterium]